MALHLAEIFRTVTPGAHAVLLLDQAGWHLSAKLDIPDNITLMPLPPKSPELNPVEKIWQFIRDNWLSDRIFQSYDDIVDHCCFAWNRLVDQPWTIMSIGLRNWGTSVLISGTWYKLLRQHGIDLARQQPPAVPHDTIERAAGGWRHLCDEVR